MRQRESSLRQWEEEVTFRKVPFILTFYTALTFSTTCATLTMLWNLQWLVRFEGIKKKRKCGEITDSEVGPGWYSFRFLLKQSDSKKQARQENVERQWIREFDGEVGGKGCLVWSQTTIFTHQWLPMNVTETTLTYNCCWLFLDLIHQLDLIARRMAAPWREWRELLASYWWIASVPWVYEY